MTTNRPTPEGAWDHEVPVHLEDTASISPDDALAQPAPLLAVGLLHYTKENVQMLDGQLKGWKTIGVAVAISALGALQASGLTDVIPPVYVGPAMMAIGFVMAWLRTQSDTTVFANTSPAPTPVVPTPKSSGTF
jgi:hypothetical protein